MLYRAKFGIAFCLCSKPACRINPLKGSQNGFSIEKTELENNLPSSDAKLLMLKLELLKRIDLFNPLSPSTIKFIVKNSRDIYLKEGDVLIEEGEPGKIMYVILSGQIMIYKGGKKIPLWARANTWGRCR